MTNRNEVLTVGIILVAAICVTVLGRISGETRMMLSGGVVTGAAAVYLVTIWREGKVG